VQRERLDFGWILGCQPHPGGGAQRETEDVGLLDAHRLQEESFVGLRRYDLFGHTLPIDIRETETEFVIEASLPGMKTEEVQITATPDQVTIRATKKAEEKQEKAGTYMRQERYEGELSRTILLPTSVNPEGATAMYAHGVLTLTLPKTPHAAAKQIPVRVTEAPAS
jgi:HSP20 family protein